MWRHVLPELICQRRTRPLGKHPQWPPWSRRSQEFLWSWSWWIHLSPPRNEKLSWGEPSHHSPVSIHIANVNPTLSRLDSSIACKLPHGQQCDGQVFATIWRLEFVRDKAHVSVLSHWPSSHGSADAVVLQPCLDLLQGSCPPSRWRSKQLEDKNNCSMTRTRQTLIPEVECCLWQNLHTHNSRRTLRT